MTTGRSSMLNWDVLDIVLSFANPYEALQFSMTCRDGHNLAIPRFLEEIEFPLPWLRLPGAKRSSLAYPELFEGFRAYMLDSPYASDRLRKLKALTLGDDAFCVERGKRGSATEPPTYTLTLAAPLADVIRGAVELRKISIHYAEEIFDDVPQLIDAIASLPRLQEVRFWDADVLTLGLLSRMQSRPRKAELRVVEYNDRETDERWWGDHAFGDDRFLSNFTESLEVLSLHGGLNIIQELEPPMVWRAVRELKLVRNDSVNLQALARAFPNLRRLDISSKFSPAVPHISQWRQLDFVSSGRPLPLQHPVRHLDMRWDFRKKPSMSGMLVGRSNRHLERPTINMLQRTMPVVLGCKADPNTYAIIARHAPSIRCMRITPSWRWSHRENDRSLTWEDAGTFLTEEFSLLRALPLQGVAIVLWGHIPWCETSHWKQYARVIGTCVPTLEYIGLRRQAEAEEYYDQWDRQEREPYQWFQVAGREEQSEVDVETLSDEEGGRVQSGLFSMA